MNELVNSVGLAGSILLILAFSRCTLNSAFSGTSTFLLLNICGSILLLPSAFFHDSTAAQGICLFWIIASGFALSNKNILSSRLLYPMSGIFTIFVVYSIAMIQGMASIEGVAKIASLLSVEIFVVSYALFIGKYIGEKHYFLATLIGNAIFIPCLYLENNIASLSLQTFCFVMSLVGLFRLWKGARQAVNPFG